MRAAAYAIKIRFAGRKIRGARRAAKRGRLRGVSQYASHPDQAGERYARGRCLETSFAHQ